MKKIVVLFLILISLFSFSGCKVETKADENIQPNSMFVVVECSNDWKIVYHKETKVMYAVSGGQYAYGTFVLLVNSDGTPMLWGEE